MLLSSPKAWRRRSRALSCNSADWNSYLMLSHVLEGLVKGKSACFSIHAMYCTLRQSLSVKGYCCQGGDTCGSICYLNLGTSPDD